MKKAVRVGLVGATGAVGQELCRVLDERAFPAAELIPLATEKSQGETVAFAGTDLDVQMVGTDVFRRLDLAFFCADDRTARELAPRAVAEGCVVIDASSAFRLEHGCPLCVPELNEEALSMHEGIIASPGALATGLSLLLSPMLEDPGVRRAVVTALLPVSYAGVSGIQELEKQVADLMNMRELQPGTFRDQIAFNVLPYGREFLENEMTADEAETPREVSRILGDEDLSLSVACSYVPVFYGLSLSLNVQTEKPVRPKDLRARLVQREGLHVVDNPVNGIYPMPVDATGENDILVGRIREDPSVENGLALWCCLDTLRSGSSVNMVRIAEQLMKYSLLRVPRKG